MQYRTLGRTGMEVSTISLGCWAIGGTWGTVDDKESLRALHQAVDEGINFFDTADVYGDGHSERLIGQLLKERREKLFVATKAGKRLAPNVAEFNRANLTACIERSLKNLGIETVDLLQLHCPPVEVYYTPEVFGLLDDLVKAGKLRFYGVSIERQEEGLKAMEYPGVQSIQVIYNIFRQRPAELLFTEAKKRKVGILARVPLASGLLSGKMTAATTFEADDHRRYNRKGEAFDVGETFSGIPYELGLQLVEELRPLIPKGVAMAPWALRWILMNDAVTCAIPGAKRPDQVTSNASAAELPALAPEAMQRILAIYNEKVRPLVHQRW
jgi:aryl-alcohol dehydrogenase-like predicted oxidoreductase